MPFARPASFRPFRQPGGKRDFAKRASGFVKRALDVPGIPYLWIACAAAAALMIVTGGFHTGDLALGSRTGFWLLLMGWNALKWQALFALFIRRNADWLPVSLAGSIPLNLTLPIEIALAGHAVGAPMPAPAGEIWMRAAAISLGIFAVSASLGWVAYRRARPAVIMQGGLLARARIDPGSLLAIQAEDHYCRVHCREGASALIHYRFGDALDEVAGIDGTQVHRGAWVAAGAVRGAIREGRRWELLLAGGQRVPVSATHLPQARARGWIRSNRRDPCVSPAR